MECSSRDLSCSLVKSNDQMAVDPQLTLEDLIMRMDGLETSRPEKAKLVEALRIQNMKLATRLDEIAAENKQLATCLEVACTETAKLAAALKKVQAEQATSSGPVRQLLAFAKNFPRADNEDKMVVE